jgi:hypothetical protein
MMACGLWDADRNNPNNNPDKPSNNPNHESVRPIPHQNCKTLFFFADWRFIC